LPGIAVALAVWCGATITSATAGDALDLGDAIKATFVYKFVPFVSWPPNAFSSPQTPFEICLSGQDSVADIIERLAAGQVAGTRRVVVRRLSTGQPASGCQILYLANADPHLAEVEMHYPVLTITDGATDNSHGLINFVIEDNHVRFDVDDAAAREANLAISSKLLALAHNVVTSPAHGS
jgi:hypothetical protein